MRIKDLVSQSSLGGGADGNPEPNIRFRILDDDQVTATPGLVLSHNNTLEISEGKSKTFTVKLATNPGATVSVAVSFLDSSYTMYVGCPHRQSCLTLIHYIQLESTANDYSHGACGRGCGQRKDLPSN